MLSLQEILDKVVNGLRKQGCKSLDCRNSCMYRGPNDTKCAAGQLILDEHYDERFEGHPVYGPPDHPKVIGVRNALRLSGCNIGDSRTFELVSDLQRLHDSLDIEDWEEGFKITAQDFGLEYPPLSFTHEV